MIDTWRLLRGKVWIVRNTIRRPAKLDRFKSMFFFGLGVLFFFAVLYGSIAFFQKLAAEEPFGSILVHKLVEFLFMTFLAVLAFSSVITSLNALFLDSDLPMLVTSPITFGRLYLARFLQALVMTGWMVVVFGIPVFMACGIVFEAPWHFYPWMFVVLSSFIVLPTAVGTLLTFSLVRVFPARKMQDILVILAVVLVIVLYVMFRFIRPEQLFNPDIFHGFAEYFATLKTPDSPLLPSTWASIALLAPIDRKMDGDGIFFVLQLLAWGGIVVLIGVESARHLYLEAFTKSQEGRRLTITGTPLARKFFDRLARRRDPVMRELFLKELRGFFRDTSQWTQLLLLLALVTVYLFNFASLDLDRFAGVTHGLRNTLAYVNLALGGFVLAAISVRFVLPAVSLEGKAFWIIRTAPVSIPRFVWGKLRFYLPPMLIVAQTLIVASNWLLGSNLFMLVFSAVVTGMLAVAITALAIGIGAMYPNFDEKNIARIATGISSLIFMTWAFALIVATVAVLAYPIRLIQFSIRTGQGLFPSQWMIIGLSMVLVLTIISAATWTAMRMGIASLDAREL
ncbi:hypothetical protein K8I61_17470 [bacterium]|nr:hypothetical protein [bacterium]